MSTRMQKIEISEHATTDDGGSLLTPSLLTATGSVEASSHHTDEEGASEIRVDDTVAAAGASLNLEDIFDVEDSERPLKINLLRRIHIQGLTFTFFSKEPAGLLNHFFREPV